MIVVVNGNWTSEFSILLFELLYTVSPYIDLLCHCTVHWCCVFTVSALFHALQIFKEEIFQKADFVEGRWFLGYRYRL